MVKLFILLSSIIMTIIGVKLINPLTTPYLLISIVIIFIITILIQAVIFFGLVFILSLFVRKKEYSYNSFYRRIFNLYERFILSLFNVKVNVTGLEKIDKNSNFVLCFNHLSNLDTMVLDKILYDIPLVFIGKESLFKIPFFGKIITKVGYISLNRENLRSELKSIKRGIDLINNKISSVGVAPEGTRNFTDKILLEFKPGCFRLVTKTDANIVIAIIKGTEKVKENLIFKKHIVNVDFVKVIEHEEMKDMSTNDISDLVMNTMLENLK